MSTYDFPAIMPSSTDLSFNPNESTTTSPFTNATQTVQLAGTVWGLTMKFDSLEEDERIELWAFLVKLKGLKHRVRLRDFGYTRRGVGGGTPLVNGTYQTGNTLTIDGLPGSTQNWLRVGDYFRIGNQLKMVTESVNSNASGQATVNFEPEVRSFPADGAPIFIDDNNVWGVFMIPGSAQRPTKPPLVSNFSITAVEDVKA